MSITDKYIKQYGGTPPMPGSILVLMKKIILCASLACASLLVFSCNDNTNNQPGTHTHDDGSVHTDHTADSIKPAQQEFKVDSTSIPSDTTAKKPHTHADGRTHTH